MNDGSPQSQARPRGGPPVQLNVTLHEQATLLPLQALPVGVAPIRFRIGVFDAGGQMIDAAIHRRSSYATEAPPFETAQASSPGDFVYGGILWDHYGHFLLEGLSRAWAFAHWPGPILWQRRSQRAEFLGWQREILDALGLGGREHRVVTSPLRVGRLAVPEQGLVMWRYLHPLQEAALAIHHFHEPQPGRRVWLSRSALPEARARLEGEAEIEAMLAADGWTILHPETVSVGEQLAAIESAAMIAGFAGSAFHTLVLGRDIRARIVIFSRHARMNGNYHLIGSAKKLDQTITQVDLELLRGEGATASFRVLQPAQLLATLCTAEEGRSPS